MKFKTPTTVILAMALFGCSHGPIRRARIDEMLNSYAGAIRWGEFQKAQEFQRPSKRSPLDLEWLKNIHVSSYEVTYKKEGLNDNIREQTVKIRYFIENSGVEKSVTDQQFWRFDEEQNKLMLESDLPNFQ